MISTQVFSFEFCKILKSIFFTEHLRTTASEITVVFQFSPLNQTSSNSLSSDACITLSYDNTLLWLLYNRWWYLAVAKGIYSVSILIDSWYLSNVFVRCGQCQLTSLIWENIVNLTLMFKPLKSLSFFIEVIKIYWSILNIKMQWP